MIPTYSNAKMPAICASGNNANNIANNQVGYRMLCYNLPYGMLTAAFGRCDKLS